MKTTVIQYSVSDSSLGSVLVASSDKGICAVLLGTSAAVLTQDLQVRFPDAQLLGAAATELHKKVVAFVNATSTRFDVPLDTRGSDFQHKVWQALRDIPAGSTASYLDIANRIGSPKSVRAVARACAANPIAIGIPCHRVVRSDGGLSGYRWGIERKRALLAREGAR